MMQAMKWALLLCLFIGAIPAGAQTAYVSGTTTLDYDAQTNTMIGTCTMTASYTTLAYYTPYSGCVIFITGTETIEAVGWSPSITGGDSASFNSTAEFTPSAGVSYTASGGYGGLLLYFSIIYTQYGYSESGWDPWDYSYYEEDPEDCLTNACTWPGAWTPTIYVEGAAVLLGDVYSNPVSAPVCSINITPLIFQASNCNGQSANNAIITANLSPAGQCYVNASSESTNCSVGTASGNVDVGAGGCTLYSISPYANPTGQFTYFAGPGISGQEVGSIPVGFSLLVNTIVITQNATIPVQCP